jgi:hypothetical protein
MHSIQFSGNSELSQIAQNSIAMKLIRSQRDKNTGLLTLVFDFIFCPSQSFMFVFTKFLTVLLNGYFILIFFQKELMHIYR